MWVELADKLRQGDILLYLMLGFTCLGSIIFFERLIMLLWVYNLDFNKYLSTVRKYLTEDEKDRAAQYSKSISKTSLPGICIKALEVSDASPTSVKGTIDEETLAFLPKIERRISLLPSLALFILMIGVLGTIQSLWSTLHSVDVLSSSQKQIAVSLGMATALIYTTMGVLGATFCLAANQIVKSLALNLLDKLHHGVTTLQNLLVPQTAMPSFSAPVFTPIESLSQPSLDEASPVSKLEGQQKTETVQQEEIFDDTPVEDIKDEEEII